MYVYTRQRENSFGKQTEVFGWRKDREKEERGEVAEKYCVLQSIRTCARAYTLAQFSQATDALLLQTYINICMHKFANNATNN